MIYEECYKQIRREFRAECLVETKIHSVGKEYKVITFAKPNSFIYVENKDGYQYLTFETFFKFLEKFKII